MAKDFYLKQAILNDDLVRLYFKAKRVYQLSALKVPDGGYPIQGPYRAFEHHYGKEVCRVCENLYNANYKRYSRVHKKVTNLVEDGSALFVTLTFRDDVFKDKDSTMEKRRRFVRRYLKTQCEVYVANIDFGEDKGREHYHAIVYASSIDFEPWHKQCGAIKVEHIHSSGVDSVKVSKYITKLTRHALKDTASGSDNSYRLIYSRGYKANAPAWLFAKTKKLNATAQSSKDVGDCQIGE